LFTSSRKPSQRHTFVGPWSDFVPVLDSEASGRTCDKGEALKNKSV